MTITREQQTKISAHRAALVAALDAAKIHEGAMCRRYYRGQTVDVCSPYGAALAAVARAEQALKAWDAHVAAISA